MPTTYYVKTAANGGSDAANGLAIGTAWATIQKAANTVAAGDTVKVDSGTYTNGFRSITGGTSTNRITFEPYAGTGTYADSGIIITGFATASGQLGPVWIAHPYITVKGFNCTTNSSKGQFQAFNGATGVWFINNRSYGGNNHWGIKVTDSDEVIAEGNLCESSSGEHGIYFSGSNNGVIRNNVCKNNTWDGIHTNISDFAGQTVFNNGGHTIEGNTCFGNGLSGMDHTGLFNSTVRNNLCYNNTNHGLSVQNLSTLCSIPPCHDNVFVNNTLLSNGGASRAAIRFAADDLGGANSNDINTTCFNNILIGTAGAGSLEHYNGVSATFKSDYNIVVDVFRTTSSTDITFSAWKTATGEDAHSAISTTSALFTNSAVDDYTLKSTSPARDVGTSTFNSQSPPTTDILGNSRPQNGTYDIGAYEYVVSGALLGGIYTRGLLRAVDGTFDLDSSTLKVLLVDSAYSFDPDHSSVDPGTNDSADISFCEIVATNYTGGFAGAGRKTATVTVVEQTANNRVVVRLADLAWAALGGATNDTVGGAVLIREITNDAASVPVAFFDFTTITTDGSDLLLDFDGVDGNLRLSV